MLMTPNFSAAQENQFEKLSKLPIKSKKLRGQKNNKTKTIGLYLGAWKNKNPQFKEITWTKTNVKTLGINHGYEVDENEIWIKKIN